MLLAFYCYKAAGKWLHYSLSISEPARTLIMQRRMRTPRRCYRYKLIKSTISSSGIVHLCGRSCIQYCLLCFPPLAIDSIHALFLLFFLNRRRFHLSQLISFFVDLKMCGQPSPLGWLFGTGVSGSHKSCSWSAALSGGRTTDSENFLAFVLLLVRSEQFTIQRCHFLSRKRSRYCVIRVIPKLHLCGRSCCGFSLLGRLLGFMSSAAILFSPPVHLWQLRNGMRSDQAGVTGWDGPWATWSRFPAD